MLCKKAPIQSTTLNTKIAQNSLPTKTHHSGGKKEGLFMQNVKNNANALVDVTVMFDYGTFSNYITKPDLGTMRDSINTLRTSRQSAISDQKTLATTNVSTYGTCSKQVDSYSSSTTDYDTAIATATKEKAAYDSDIVNQEVSITAQDTSITSLDAQLAELKSKRTTENAVLDAAKTNSDNKKVEIDGYTTAKTADNTTRQTALKAAQDTKVSETAKFTNAVTSLKTDCVGCSTPASAAQTAFNATPYLQTTVESNINSVSVATS